MNRARILIVEDELVVARDINQQLQALGYEPVGHTARGDEAVRLAGELRPDLVLMDINLLGPLDGIDAARAIREQFVIPVIFLTAFASDPMIERATAVSPFGYIVKPFEERELRTIIEVGLQQHRTEARLRRSEEEMSAVLRSSMDSFWVVDLQGRVLRMNDAASHLMGFTREELLTMSIVDLEYGRTREEIAQGVAAVVRLGSVQIERWIKRKDGAIRLVEMSVTCTPGPDRLLYCFGRDITDRRRAEEAKAWQAAIIQNSTDICSVKDPHLRVLAANAAFAQAAGVASTCDLIGRTDAEIFGLSPDAEPVRSYMADERLAQLLPPGKHIQREELLVRPDGVERILLTRRFPVFDSVGNRIATATISTDITDSKATAAALHETAERSRVLLEHVGEGIAIVDLEERFTFGNRAAEAIFGVEPGTLPGRNLADFTTPEQHQRVLAQTVDRRAGKKTLYDLEIRRPDGHTHNLLVTAVPQFNESGILVGTLGVFRDITERRRAEEQLRQLSRAVEQSPAAIVITDAAGRIEYVNPHFEKITGYTLAEVAGKNPRVLKSGEQSAEFYRHLWQTITAGGEWSGEFLNRKKNGELFWEQASISPLRDEQGRIGNFLAVKEDITPRKEAEQRLIQAKAEMQQTNAQLQVSIAAARELAVAADAANRAKSAFLTNMSHELRTPLNVINGVAATLLEQAETPAQKEAAKLILEGGDNLLGIIEEILDYSGLQAGKARLNPRSFDLLAVVAQTLRVIRKTSQSSGVELSYHIDPAAPAEVVGDPRRLQQILLNLLNNAQKFTERGRVHLGISARARESGSWLLRFTVSDTGRGIAAEDLNHLFQPFSRIEGTSTRTTGGAGLGLIIARSFAQLMGGDIVVRSRPGRGSVFLCTAVVGRAESGATVFAPAAPAGLPGRRVLIVSNDARHRRLLSSVAHAWSLLPTVLSGEQATTAALPARERGLLAIVDLECVRNRQGDLARWFAPGSAGHIVPVAWLTRPEAPEPIPTAAPQTVLALPADLAELARVLAGFAIQKPLTAAVPATTAPTQPKLGQRLPLRILAADDIRTNREMLRHMMLHLGYTLTLVENGAEVLDALRLQPFDLVLLDVQMPVMDGLTAAREICRLQPDPTKRPKLVAVTANALPGDRETCLGAGMDEYLTKPVLPSQIESCLLRFFAAAHPVAPPPPPAPPAELPWIDRNHLEAFLPGLPPQELAAALSQMHAAAANDFRQIWPKLVEVCVERNTPRFAEIAHGLKGCFLMLGWARVADLCITALAQARKGEFTEWDTFPARLQQCHTASSAAMDECLASMCSGAPVAGNPPPATRTTESSARSTTA